MLFGYHASSAGLEVEDPHLMKSSILVLIVVMLVLIVVMLVLVVVMLVLIVVILVLVVVILVLAVTVLTLCSGISPYKPVSLWGSQIRCGRTWN